MTQDMSVGVVVGIGMPAFMPSLKPAHINGTVAAVTGSGLSCSIVVHFGEWL